MPTEPLPSGKAKRPTSRDVAVAANVSQALVSRAFSGGGRIAPGTRDRILKAAAEIGWQPNALAASMVTGDAPLVAVITARLSSEWRAQVLSHLLATIEAWHLKPILFYAESDEEVDRLLGETLSWRTRGVIVTAGDIAPPRADAILAQGQFLASLNRAANHPAGFSVATDNVLGGGMAASLLAGEGHRSFVVLAGPDPSWASTSRTRGFLAGLRQVERSAAVWHSDNMTTEAGKACAVRYLELAPAERPSAVFATNDAMALGFMDGLRARGEILSQVSIVGFDNLAVSSWTPYQLTTLEQPIDDMAKRVLGHIEWHQAGSRADERPRAVGRQGDDNVEYFAPRLIVRGTTRSHP